jgi:hypothetical protein
MFYWFFQQGTLFDPPEDKTLRITLPTPFPWRCCRTKYRRYHRNFGCRQRSIHLLHSLFNGSDLPFLKGLRQRLRSGVSRPATKRRATRKHSRWRRRPPDVWSPLDPDEAEQDRKADFARLWPRMLRFTAVTYGLRYGADLHAFVDDQDPLAQLSMLRQLSDPTHLGTTRSIARMNNSIDETVALARTFSTALQVASTRSNQWSLRSFVASLPLETSDLTNYKFLDDTPFSSSNIERQVYRASNHRQPQQQSVDACDDPVLNTPIVIDTGASMNLTPFREDFVGPIEPLSFPVNGLSGTAKVEGVGTVEWRIIDYFGSVQTIRTKAYLIPSIQVRLYSPQFHFCDEQSGSLHVDHRRAKLSLPHSSSEVEFPFAPNNSPGDSLYVDQYQSSVPGRLAHTNGREKDAMKLNGGLIAVDGAFGKVFLRHQVSLRSGETVEAMRSIVRDARQYGVSFKHVHSDNHPFPSTDFRNYVAKEMDAQHTFSGVGAKFQNGVAERAIQTITAWARTMMLHSIMHWPDAANLELWPFAMDHAVYLWNHLPRKDTLIAPEELFTGVQSVNYELLQRSHVWGCPAYVLDPALQDGKKLPKWKVHSRRGQYLGVSTGHSSSVARILSHATGNISSQWHVVYDDLFSTVFSPEFGTPFDDRSFNADEWSKLVESGHERYIFDEVNEHGTPLAVPPLDTEWRTAQDALDPPPPAPVLAPPVRPLNPVPSIRHEVDQTLRRLRENAINPDDVPVPPPAPPTPLASEGARSLSPPSIRKWTKLRSPQSSQIPVSTNQSLLMIRLRPQIVSPPIQAHAAAVQFASVVPTVVSSAPNGSIRPNVHPTVVKSECTASTSNTFNP